MFLRNLFCAMLALSVAACASERAVGKLPAGATLGPADAVKQEARQEYRLFPSDLIEVQVFNVPSLTQQVQVDNGGDIILPLIGQVPASGKTPQELSKDLQRLYGDKYLQNPQISVLVRKGRQETITVDGSVTAPGVFAVTDQTSLIKAIALAKGLDSLANPKQVVVFRNVNNQRVAGVFDLTQIRAGQAVDPPIFPNDTIVVAGSGLRRTLHDIIGVTPLVGLITLVP